MTQENIVGISVRGTRDGVSISLGEGAWDDLLSKLAERLHATGAFFSGSRVTLDVSDRALAGEQLRALEDILNRHDMGLYAIAANAPETRSAARTIGIRSVAAEPPRAAQVAESPTEPGASNSLLIRRTIRSGQMVEHVGHLAIIGDVNPGGEVIAGGDVVIWGRLRGVVHAGAIGDDAAVVCALRMQPMQLRIGNHIARAPEGQLPRPTSPEVAFVRGGAIVLEPWDEG